jgi:hypothetical protein
MIGDSIRENTVSAMTLPRRRQPPPNARLAAGRVSTSETLAIFGANHMNTVTANRAMP